MGSQTCRISRTCRTCLTRPRPNTDLCSFAFFVNIRGLKTSIEFSLFPSHEAHKSTHERERANNFAFLCVDFLIASASTIRLSADSIRKPADTKRKMTKRIRKIFIKNGLKSKKIPQNFHFPQDFARLFPPAKSKMLRRFWQKAKRRAFLNFSEEGLLSIFGKVFRSYRTSLTGRTSPRCY